MLGWSVDVCVCGEIVCSIYIAHLECSSVTNGQTIQVKEKINPRALIRTFKQRAHFHCARILEMRHPYERIEKKNLN